VVAYAYASVMFPIADLCKWVTGSDEAFSEFLFFLAYGRK
jgi:hypothetical protein